MFFRSAANEKYADLIRQHGFDDFERVMASNDGQVVGQHRTRDVVRLECYRDGCPQVFYLKREFGTQWKDVAGALVRGSGLLTKARREWEILTALQRAGIPAPEPVAYAQCATPALRGYLLLADLPGRPLAQWMHEPQWNCCRRFRRGLVGAVAEAVARLHGAGFDHPDLYSKHIWVARRDEQWEIYLIDYQRTGRYHQVPRKVRWRDLAALNATIDDRCVSRADRAFFLNRYLKAAGLSACRRESIAAILPRALRLKARRKVQELRSTQGQDAWEQRLIRVDNEMWIDRRFHAALTEAGLTGVDAVMQSNQGTLLRALPDRENVRLMLPGGSSPCCTVAYLKRHRDAALSQWLRRPWQLPDSISAGCHEAWNAMRLWRGGVRTMQVIAYGRKRTRWWHEESFLLTEEVRDAVPLDDFLRRRFGSTVGGGGGPLQRRDLRNLVHAVADVARRFHGLGYNHRDLYCCHFLVREDPPGWFALHLIDLQRMQHRRRFRRRWIVKDLAQLSYSAPSAVIGATDRLRFLKRYLRVARLGAREKRLARQILKKHARIARRGIAP